MTQPVMSSDMTLSDLKFMPPIPELEVLEEGPKEQSALSKISQAATGALSSAASSIPHGLVYVDHILDLVPFAGTASNVIDLGLKHFVVGDVDPEKSFFKPFIAHVQNKDTKECVAYGVPFVGTVAKLGYVAYDLYKGPSTKKEGYEIVDEGNSVPDETMGLSTIGLRLREQERAQADQIALSAKYPKSYPDNRF